MLHRRCPQASDFRPSGSIIIILNSFRTVCYRSSRYFYVWLSDRDPLGIHCISRFVVVFFLVLEFGSYLKILNRKKVQNAECQLFKNKRLRYMAQTCCGLVFWHRICKIGTGRARIGARCSQLKCMPSLFPTFRDTT